MAADKQDQRSEQLSAALTDQERFRLLVNAVTDYAIYMLDASATSRAGMPAPSASRAIQPGK
jgi:hypothetical protein